MSFCEFWTHLRDNMAGCAIDVIYTSDMLEFRCNFESEKKSRKAAELLRLRGVKHVYKDKSLIFWISGNFDFVYES